MINHDQFGILSSSSISDFICEFLCCYESYVSVLSVGFLLPTSNMDAILYRCPVFLRKNAPTISTPLIKSVNNIKESVLS